MNVSNQLPISAVFLDASGTLMRGTTSHPLGVELYPDATGLLTAFENRTLGGRPIKTGIITNWGNRIHKIVQSLMLEKYFDAIVCADDVPQGKPEPIIFQTACSWLEVAPGQAFHIGDSLYDDAIGAQNAGLHSLWINRRTTPGVSSTEKDVGSKLNHPVCSDLSQALKYLEKILTVR